MQPIHWFPGHMAKARRQMAESLKKVDVVLELVDARLPLASANPMVAELIGAKPKVVAMTRIDLADPHKTSQWLAFFRGHDVPVAGVDARAGVGLRDVEALLQQAAAQKRARDERRHIRPRPVRAMVVGIPNVGKSSLINRLSGRAATKTGDRPGITQQQQWIRLGSVELLDTPGVLWPKLDDEEGAFALAMSGAVKSDVIDVPTVAAYFVLWCSRHYPGALEARYGIGQLSALQVASDQLWEAAEPVLSAIAARRGLVLPGGVYDTERSAQLVLRELQTGMIGRMSFEVPPAREVSSQD